MVLILAALLCAAVGSRAGIDRIQTRSSIAATRAENRTLRARQSALHAHALEISRRLDVSDPFSLTGWPQLGGSPFPPEERAGGGAEAESVPPRPVGATQANGRGIAGASAQAPKA